MTSSNLSWPDLSTLSPNLYNKISCINCTSSLYVVTVYDQTNFLGNSYQFRAPTIALNLSDYGWNDKIKSIQATYVGTTTSITFFKDNNQSGKSYLLCPPVSVYDFGNTPIGNDSISSACLSAGMTNGWCYQDVGYTGSWALWVDNSTGSTPKNYNWGGTSYNDSISSFGV